MADITLFELLGISKEEANAVAKRVRISFSESKDPLDWIKRLIDEFDINPKNAQIFACGWFAGKYAGVSEVFNVVQKEMEEMEKDQAKKAKKESDCEPTDGYA